MEQHASKSVRLRQTMEQKLQKQNPIAYKNNDKTINCNKYQNVSHPVSCGVYGIKESDFNLCCGENPDSMPLSLHLGLLDCHVEYDVLCL